MVVLPILLTEGDRIRLKTAIQIGLSVSALLSLLLVYGGASIGSAVREDGQKSKQVHRLHDADLLFTQFIYAIIFASSVFVVSHLVPVAVVELVMRQSPELRHEKKNWLYGTTFHLTLLLIFECALLCLALSCHWTIQSSHSEVMDWYVEGFKRNFDPTILLIQQENECCGSAGPDDWPENQSGWHIPESCCRNASSSCGEEGSDETLFSSGCADVLSAWYRKTSLSLLIFCGVMILIDVFVSILMTYLQTSVRDVIVMEGLVFPSYGYMGSGGQKRKKLKTRAMRTTFSSRSMATTNGLTVAQTVGAANPDQEVQVTALLLVPEVRPSIVEPDIFAARTQIDVPEKRERGNVSRLSQLLEKERRPAKYQMKYFLVQEME